MRARPKGNERESLDEVLKGITDPADRVVRMVAWRSWEFWQPQVDKVQRIMSAYWAIVAEHGVDAVTEDYLIKQGWTPPKEIISARRKKTVLGGAGSNGFRASTIPGSDSVYDDGPDSGRMLRSDDYSTPGLRIGIDA